MTETQSLPDLATLDGFEQLQAIFDGRLPGAPIAETLGLDGLRRRARCDPRRAGAASSATTTRSARCTAG